MKSIGYLFVTPKYQCYKLVNFNNYLQKYDKDLIFSKKFEFCTKNITLKILKKAHSLKDFP